MGEVAAITALEHPASNKKRLRIWLDGDPFRTTNRRVGRALELEVGQQVEAGEFSEQLDEEERRQAKEHALRYLTYRARSRGELERRLRDVGYGTAATEATMRFLDSVGYLDDESFAEQWIGERCRLKQYGRRRIVAELVAKGLQPEQVAALLDRYCPESGEAARALSVARRRLTGVDGLERLAAIRRLGPYLLRKGYSGTAVSGALAELSAESCETDVGVTE